MMLKPIKLATLFWSLTEGSIEANSEIDVSCGLLDVLGGLLDVLACKLLEQFELIIFFITPYNCKSNGGLV